MRGGRAWAGAVAGGHAWQGACMGKGHVHGEGGCAWRREGMRGMHAPGSVTTRYGRSMRGRYASYILVSNYISLKYIRPRFDALLTRLASVTADLRWSPLLPSLIYQHTKGISY